MGKSIEPKRGDVYLVKFDPTVGAEIKKTRPAVILQNDIANKHSSLTIIAAITSFDGGRLYPTDVHIPKGTGLDKESVILLNQVRTIDKTRLIKKLGVLDKETMRRVDIALIVSLALR